MAPKPLSATERMRRSRERTKSVMIRELMFAGILARLWPAYITEPRIAQLNYPYLLCIDSPQGLLVWRLTRDEEPFFDWLPRRKNPGRVQVDKATALYTLAAEGWM